MTKKATITPLIIPFLLSLIVGFLTFANALSTFYTKEDPPFALKLNPFNLNARMQDLANSFKNNEDKISSEPKFLADKVKAGIALEPTNTHFFVYYGLLKQQNSPKAAQAYYDHALKLFYAQPQALVQKYIHHLQQGNFLKAAIIAERYYVRWKKNWKAITPSIPLLLSNETGYQETLKRFSNKPNGIFRIVEALTQTNSNYEQASRFVIDANDANVENLRPTLNFLIRKMIANEDYSNAYLLFHNTLNANEKLETGYIFNAAFNLEFNKSNFDWHTRKQSGVSFKQHNTNEDLSRTKGLEIRFLNTPIKFSNIRQDLYLLPTTYELSITYSAKDLRAPRPIKARISCLYPKRQRIIELPLANNNAENLVTSVRFDVPKQDCEIQRIQFFNDTLVETWRNRYSGSLILQNVSIKLAGS